jgi:two-component SAPR family response regulator
VQVQTIPGFAVRVDGAALQIRRPKVRELFALLIDRGERGLTTGEGISLLWPERPGDTNAQALFRMTYKRLVDTLNEAGIGGILGSDGSRRYIHRHMVDCDLYSILEGDPDAAKKYAGEYLTEYSWAETRNGQLYRMLF